MGNIIGYFKHNNEFLLKNIIMDIFSETEYEALDYLMYQLAICYFNKPNEDIYLILNDNESYRSSFLINLIKYTFYNRYITLDINNLTNGNNNLLNKDKYNFNIHIYSNSEKNVILNYDKMKNNENKYFHLIITKHNITIDNKNETNNILFYKFKNKNNEKIDKHNNYDIFNLSNKININSQFEYILYLYYNKLKKEYNNNINNVPNGIIITDTYLWKNNL